MGKGALQNPTGIKVWTRPTAYGRAHNYDWWWTPERLAKLRYVMEKYDDVAKAARVLGCSEGNVRWRWIGLRDGLEPRRKGKGAATP